MSAIKDCVACLTPRYFDGVRDKRRSRVPQFFRTVIFNAPDVTTSKRKFYWRELTKNTPRFIPPVVKPCDDYTFIKSGDQWEEKEVGFPYVQLGSSIDCDFNHTNGADESCDGDRELGEAIRDAYREDQEMLDDALDFNEELWSAEYVITGQVEMQIGKSKPYYLKSERCKTLTDTLTGDARWGKDGCANPFSAIEMMDNRMFCKGRGNITTHIIMSQATCDKLKESPLINEYLCKGAPHPRMRLPSMSMSDEVSFEPSRPFNGGKLAYLIDMPNSVPLQIWCVNQDMEFKNPVTGQMVKKNLVPDGKIYGFDLSNGPDAYNAGFAYGGITNFHAGDERRFKRWSRGYIPEHGKSLKYVVESSPLPVIRCPNASWCLEVCKMDK